MLYWHQNRQNHASPPRTSATTLILTLSQKSIHCWNQLCKGFILSPFGWSVWCIMDFLFLVYVVVFLR